jgi:hypothetical protein
MIDTNLGHELKHRTTQVLRRSGKWLRAKPECIRNYKTYRNVMPRTNMIRCGQWCREAVACAHNRTLANRVGSQHIPAGCNRYIDCKGLNDGQSRNVSKNQQFKDLSASGMRIRARNPAREEGTTVQAGMLNRTSSLPIYLQAKSGAIYEMRPVNVTRGHVTSGP